jgi:hypothetical protein
VRALLGYQQALWGVLEGEGEYLATGVVRVVPEEGLGFENYVVGLKKLKPCGFLNHCRRLFNRLHQGTHLLFHRTASDHQS